MQEQIVKHLEIYGAVKKSGLPWKFIKKFEESKVLAAARMVIQCDINGQIQRMTEAMSAYIVRDVNFCGYIQRLSQKGIAAVRIGELMKQAEGKLSMYPYEQVEQVLLDENVSSEILFPYLAYYRTYNLGSCQKRRLGSGLRNWAQYAGRPLAEAAEEERKILWQPALSVDMLQKLLGERRVWDELVKEEVLTLLNGLVERGCGGIYLDQEQFFQLAERPDEIRKGLWFVLGFIDEGLELSFLNLWLCNKALAYDLKKLENQLPHMEKDQAVRVARSRAAYISALYQCEMADIDLTELSQAQEEVLIYAINRRKKHFLSLIKENLEDFRCLPDHSLLLDPYIYRGCLELNALNSRDLKDCFSLRKMGKAKEHMTQGAYTFGELKALAPLRESYVALYHCLQHRRSDDRLRVFREITKKKCLPGCLSKEDIMCLGGKLSQKPLSRWIQEELAHIKDLRPDTAIKWLCCQERLAPFIKDIFSNSQMEFLLRNQEKLGGYRDFEELQGHVLEVDEAWQYLKKEFKFEDAFIQENRERTLQFVYAGGSEILYSFCQDGSGKEEVRRLLAAELLGRFREVKYHTGDLEKEIAYPITDSMETVWKANTVLTGAGLKAWEEDKFLPIMEIGEKPTRTCMSYHDGAYKECLLSCFDSNKKVIFMEMAGEIVFRAIIRLTKGSFSYCGKKKVEFADLTRKGDFADGSGDKEELVLFVERPYYKRLSDVGQAVSLLVEMMRQKAAALHARLVFSENYQPYLPEGDFAKAKYYVYISASKNGSQYLDSLGGAASVSSSERYEKSILLMEYGGNAVAGSSPKDAALLKRTG